MTTRTSKLKAIQPQRWGYRKIDIVFGRVRAANDQNWALCGDLIQNKRNGSVWEFQYREGNSLRGYPVKVEK